MTISQRIFELLKKNNKKQKELSESIGLSTSAISDWKKKGTNPAAENISAIADFFNVSTDFLLTGEEKSKDYLRDDEQKLLKMYNLLFEIEKGEVLGELREKTKDRNEQ